MCPDEGLCTRGRRSKCTAPVMSLSRDRWDAVSKVTGLACSLGSALGVRGRIPAFLGNGQVWGLLEVMVLLEAGQL